MDKFNNSTRPLIIVFLLLLILSAGVIISCASPHKQLETDAGERDSSKVALDQNKLNEASFPALSADMLQRVIEGKPVEKHMEILKNVHPDTLDKALNTGRKRLTFWINIYNGFTQYFLKTDPALYKNDRSAYFDADQIEIAGYTVSFNDIEHGILRRGATIWSKGYIRIRAFRSNFIQKYAMDTMDFRIHFALNCGAKSCPPVVIYYEDYVARQLNDNTRYYLKKEVEYNKQENVVKVPALMSWFSADFGGDDADKRAILREYGVLPQGVRPNVKYLPYDWTMQIENYKSYSY